jgi:hypothetical protein
MATTTPNYGWPVPTSTDYVKDGATAIEALGDAIDATVFGLGAGLKLIKKQVIGTGVSSVNVTAAFSSTYDFYKIVIGGTPVTSTGTSIALKLGASTTGYYASGILSSYAGTSTVLNVNNGSAWTYGAWGGTSTVTCNIDLIGPGTATFTKIYSKYTATADTTYQDGMHQVATAYTDFTLTPSSGTMTGGTIYVYGYGTS